MSENKGKSVGMMAIVALFVSEVWIVLGYMGNLYGAMTAAGYTIWFLAFTGMITVVNLFLIPFVVKEKKWAFLAATIVGIVLLLVILVAGPVYTVATTGWQSTTDYQLAVGGGIVWLVLQIPVIFFSFRAYRKL
jgi:cytochrome c oxidase assembly factor CtaG